MAANFCVRNSRDGMTSLWSDTHAPICDSRGRVAKYSRDSALPILSTTPCTMTCRSSVIHGNNRLTRGLPAISAALRL